MQEDISIMLNRNILFKRCYRLKDIFLLKKAKKYTEQNNVKSPL